MRMDLYKEEKERKFWSGPATFLIMVIICNFFWAIAVPINKISNQAFSLESTDTMALFTFAGIRLVGAGLIALAFCCLKGIKLLPAKKELSSLLKLGLLMSAGQYACLYLGTAMSPGVVVSILSSSGSFEGILFSSLVFKNDKLTVRKLLGCALGVIAVVILNIQDLHTGITISVLGSALIILSQGCGTLGAVYLKYISNGRPAIWIGGWQSLLGGLALLAAGLLGGGTVKARELSVVSVGSVVVLIIISALALIISNQLYKYNDISRVVIFSLLLPVFGALTSAVMLGESLASTALLASLAIDCAGVWLVSVERKKKKGEK